MQKGWTKLWWLIRIKGATGRFCFFRQSHISCSSASSLSYANQLLHITSNILYIQACECDINLVTQVSQHAYFQNVALFQEMAHWTFILPQWASHSPHTPMQNAVSANGSGFACCSRTRRHVESWIEPPALKWMTHSTIWATATNCSLLSSPCCQSVCVAFVTLPFCYCFLLFACMYFRSGFCVACFQLMR